MNARVKSLSFLRELQYAYGPADNRGIAAGWAADEIERLDAIVGKLPCTADGEHVVPGMETVWWYDPHLRPRIHERGITLDVDTWVLIGCGKSVAEAYSSREAAEAAWENEDG